MLEAALQRSCISPPNKTFEISHWMSNGALHRVVNASMSLAVRQTTRHLQPCCKTGLQHQDLEPKVRPLCSLLLRSMHLRLRENVFMNGPPHPDLMPTRPRSNVWIATWCSARSRRTAMPTWRRKTSMNVLMTTRTTGALQPPRGNGAARTVARKKVASNSPAHLDEWVQRPSHLPLQMWHHLDDHHMAQHRRGAAQRLWWT